jgi:general secretion pathway protein C
VAPGSYVIDQRALNASLDNMGQAMTDARLLPSLKDGKVEGFKASEVKPAGIFGMVGIKNGDTLLRINDFSIDSPDKAIQSLVSLKGQSKIKLDLIRNGQPTTFNYDIR